MDDQVLVSDGDGIDGITGVTTVLVGGYKPSWHNGFVQLLAGLDDCVVFNTAGAPVTRKAILNSDVVVIQRASTLWDGIGAYLFARAGGYVVFDGSTEPLPREAVEQWFDRLPYEYRDGVGVTESICIPAFVAGMDWERTAAIASAVKSVRGLG